MMIVINSPDSILSEKMTKYENPPPSRLSRLVTRTDASIDFDWGTGSPHASISSDNFSVRWTATATTSAGLYHFAMTGDDGVRLKIDGNTVIDGWVDQGATTYEQTVNLTAGSHTIVMEYYDSGWDAVAKLTFERISDDTVSVSNLTSGTESDNNSTATTASVTPSANKLLLLTVTSRTGITANPNQPTVTGNGLTWVAVGSTVFDPTSSSRRRVTLFRAMGSSPTSGTVGIDFSGQNQTDVAWGLDQVSGVDTSGTNGSGAIVQSVVNQNPTDTGVTSLTATLSTFTSSNNATYGAFGNGGEGSFTAGSGFSISGQNGTSGGVRAGSEFKTGNDTSVDISTPTANIGGIAIELKAAVVTSPTTSVRSSSTNGSSTGTAMSVSAPSGVQAGDLVIVYVHGNTQTTIVDNNGGTAFTEDINDYHPNTSHGHTASVFSRRIQTGDPSTYNFTLGASGRWSIVAVAIQNPNATTIYDVSPTTTNNADGDIDNFDAPSITTQTDGAIHIAMVGFDSGQAASSGTPSGYTAVTQNNQPIALGYKTISTPSATGTKNFTFSNDFSSFVGISLAIKPITASSSGSAAASYTYDANGNMTSDGLKLYEYNEANQLKRVKSATNSATIADYIYDYNGNRMVKKNYTNGSLANTVYSWSDSFETKDTGGSIQTTVYYFANNELVAKKNPDGSINYVHNDHLGSSSILTNSGGTLVEATSYDPWGVVTSGGTQSKFQYTGQEKDSETGLNYYNARYYSSDIRRFTQPDDIIQNAYEPQELNKYSYVKNNPLRYTDPNGHVAIVPILLIGAGFGAAGNIANVAMTNPNAQWQDYAYAGVTGAGVGALTMGVTLLATPVAASGLGAVGVSGVVRSIGADAVVGGLISGGKQVYNNIRNKQSFLQNVSQSIALGSITAGVSSYGANKIIPQTVGRPAEKLTISFSGAKSVQQVQRTGVSEFIEKLTLPITAKVISNNLPKATAFQSTATVKATGSPLLDQYLKYR